MLVRILLVAVCAFASWWSVRMAWADWLADSESPEALRRAVQLEPNDARLRAMNAIIRSDNGDSSLAVDKDLQEALRLNPFDSTVLMTLGLRAEFRGDAAGAELCLVQAASVDHQFKPAWTLANFYARSHQPDKIWPLLRRCLELDPLGFDPAPVFDLCWTYSDDPNKILNLIPRRRPRLLEYLSYLIRTGKVDAAVQVWPQAFAIANPIEDAGVLTQFPGLLVKAGKIAQAVDAWNSLVDRIVIHSSRLNPPAGVSIADPDFNLPPTESVFSWSLASPDGVFMRKLSPSLQIEFDGNEPENVTLLQLIAPVVQGRNYKLRWKTDSSRLSLTGDAGFQFRIAQPGANTCALLTTANCAFTAAGQIVRLELIYSRAAGTIRSKGELQLFSATLEFAP